MVRKLLFALLLLAPLPALADATFFWRAEGTTLSATDDLSPDTSATLVGGASISNTAEKVGTNGILTTDANDYYTFTPTSICSVTEATLAGWIQFKTAVPSSGANLLINCTDTGDSSSARISTGSSQEARLTLTSSGGTSLNLVTTTCNLVVDEWYFIVASYHIANDDRTIACYNSSGTLINATSDLSTDLSTAAPGSFDELRVGNTGNNTNPIWVDNVFISDTYGVAFQNFHGITSYVPTYTGAPTLGTATSTSLPFTYTADQDGTTYAAACTNGQTIATFSALKSGTCSGGAAVGTANDNATATVSNTVTIGGLVAGTTYDVYVGHESSIGGQSAISSQADKATASSGIAPPAFTASVDPVPSFNGHLIEYTVDQDAQMIAIACLPGLGNPDATEIQAETCDGGAANAGFATDIAEANVPDSFTIALNDGLPRHDIHIIAVGEPATGGGDTLETYAAISGKTSDRWTCTASQGTPENSPVQMIDNSTFSQNSEENHWTQLSADGPVDMVCTDLTEDVTTATIRPTRDGITDSVDTGADSISFTLPGPGQYFVDTGEYEEPLFVFLSALDDNVPVDNGTTIKTYTGPGMDLTGVTTLIFEPGVQTIDYGTNNGGNPCNTASECTDLDIDTGTRTRFEVTCPMDLYIKGGAWVNGQILFDGGTGACKLRGRGTLAGGIYENVTDVNVHSNFVYMVHHTNYSATTLEVEGVTLAEPPGPIHRSNDAGLVLRDVKFFGAVRESGALRLNSNSVLEDSFFKANDDNVNLFGSNITASNIVHWAQQTGCLYILSWQAGNSSNYSNNLVTEVDVIQNSRVDGEYWQLINSGVVCARNVDGGDLSNQTFDDFQIEVPVFQLFAFTVKWDSAGFNDGVGSYADMTFSNWVVASDSVNGNPNGWFNSGVVAANPSKDLTGTSPGTIEGFIFDTITINGSPLDLEDDLLCEGLADCDTFTVTP